MSIPPPPPVPDDDNKITLRIVLSHMQYHAIRLDNRIDNLSSELKNELKALGKDLKNFRKEFNEFAHGVDDLDDRVQAPIV
ncbi:hypothetical protein KKC44_00360 [Patescibacteria group bacterium]|nr:hypothetical protein [Patescibacteria group bacterium]MBU2259040.1 hypothetical protein [Patescibacteria group bacterium]